MLRAGLALASSRRVLGLPLALFGLGLASEAIYLAAALRFPLFSLYTRPRLDYGKLVEYRVLDLMVFPVVTLALFALFVLSLWQVGHKRTAVSFGAVFAFAAVFQVTLTMMYPITAVDVFDYASYNRLLVRFGVNPFVVTPGDPRYAAGAFGDYAGWPNWPSPYGPLWHYLTAPIGFLAGRDLLANVVGLRLLIVGAALVDGLLIYLILRRLQPDRALLGALFWLWNPLIVFESGGNAHNGAVMLTLALLSLWLLVSGRRRWVLPALMAGALVKWPVAILLPLVVVVLARSAPSRRAMLVEVGGGGLLASGLFFGLSWPLLPGLKVLDLLTSNLQFMTGSPGALLVLLLQGHWVETPLSITVRRALAAVFVLYVAFRALRLWQGRDEFRRAAHDVMLAYLLIGSFWVMPWYASWVVVWGALTTDSRRLRADVIFAACLMAGYVVGFFWHVVRTPPLVWQLQILGVNFGALLLYLSVRAALDARDRLRRTPLLLRRSGYGSSQ